MIDFWFDKYCRLTHQYGLLKIIIHSNTDRNLKDKIYLQSLITIIIYNSDEYSLC